MVPGRIRPAEALAGVGGLALLVSLFLPWFGELDAWHSLSGIDLVIALTAALAIAVPVVAASNSKTDGPVTVEAATTLFATLAALLVALRVLDPVGGSRRGGLFLALGAAIVAWLGAWRAMADERT
jgi:hypothetical protein